MLAGFDDGVGYLLGAIRHQVGELFRVFGEAGRELLRALAHQLHDFVGMVGEPFSDLLSPIQHHVHDRGRAFGKFVAAIPPPLGIGTIRLADGRGVKGFVVEPVAVEGARDISAYGGWRAFMADGGYAR